MHYLLVLVGLILMATSVLNLKGSIMAWHTELDDLIEKVVAEAMSPAAEVGEAASAEMGEAAPSESSRPVARPTAAPSESSRPVARPDVGNDTVAERGNVYRQGDRDAGPNGDIRAAQTVLGRLGLSVGEVDGVYGRNTMNAVQDAQEMLGLPRTGVLNQTTQDGLNSLTDDQIALFTSESATIEGEQETPVESPETNEGPASSSLLDFIGSGEGNYDSANRGTIGGNIVGSQMTATRNGKAISSMTVGEIQRLQSIRDPNNTQRLFAVGKYQTIPATLANAVEGLGLSEDTVFSPEVQEQIGWFLVTEKRPRVGQYIRGEGSVTEDDAMMSLAREFASVPVPRAVRQGEFGSWPKTDLQAGDSFYSNPNAGRGNRAAHSVDETIAVLRAARQNQ